MSGRRANQRYLFRDVPDAALVAKASGLSLGDTQDALSELAWICKTISRLGRGYSLGGGLFSRPGSAADALNLALEAGERRPKREVRDLVLYPDDLGQLLYERTSFEPDAILDLIDAVDEQAGAVPDLKAQHQTIAPEIEIENEVEQCLDALAWWGHDLTQPQRQPWLEHRSARADLLCRDRSGAWVVVELKQGAALPETATQIVRYLELVAKKRAADGEEIRGIVIADGDDPEYRDEAAASGWEIEYIPTRRLDIPLCRPQMHFLDGDPDKWFKVAADGRTVVGGSPSIRARARGDVSKFISMGLRLREQGTTLGPIG